MFWKKRCKRCNEKISEKYGFCPNCGIPIIKDYNENEEYEDDKDWGLLGKNDETGFKDAEIRLPFGFNTLFNSLVKSLDNQMKEFDKELGKTKFNNIKPAANFIKSGGIRINISSGGNRSPKIIVRSFGNMPGFREQEQQIKKQAPRLSKPKEFSAKNIKKLSTLPRKEPSTNIRRLSNRVIYEIDLPDVKSEKDVSIIQLENSIEIKAIGKDSAYFKLIPINLPIKGHKLTEGKLVLELEARD
ncbi:zinc ribbon domain-containing protein [Candidatus Pacearchaeota archaeon]|nr:zinc ribbon domain-containing protein [Candidatus Pacearchaeota archaeon]